MTVGLESRWLALCETHGQPHPGETWEILESRYSEPRRAYHNLDHIQACLGWLDKVTSGAEDPVSLEFAIWFHDVIYETHAKDNELQSAHLAVSTLRAPVDVDRVRDLILATRHQATGEGDAALMCDIDLAILGSSAETYAAYQRQIREEYAWVPESDYRAGRIAVLRSFLDRPVIFASPRFSQSEEAARQNLEAEISSLGR